MFGGCKATLDPALILTCRFLYYNTRMAGFSAVLFALKAVLTHRSPGWSSVYGISVPTKVRARSSVQAAAPGLPGLTAAALGLNGLRMVNIFSWNESPVQQNQPAWLLGCTPAVRRLRPALNPKADVIRADQRAAKSVRHLGHRCNLICRVMWFWR